METRVGTLFKEYDEELSEEERNGRLDIKYRKTAGKHVIIELKRPGRRVFLHELVKQIRKYRLGMEKIIEKLKEDNPDGRSTRESVEFVCLLGDAPVESLDPGGPEEVEKTLGLQNARYMTYDALLENTFRAYSEYLEKSKRLSRLDAVIEAIAGYDEK